MREILFRGKRQSDGEWVYGGIWIEDDKIYIVGPVRYYPDTRDWGTYEYYEKNPRYVTGKIPVIPETVGQFTGRTDKNGQKIFEDDVVRAMMDYGPAGFYEVKGITIGWYDSLSGYQWQYFDMDSIKIIGNIHDNPELLKGE